MPPKKTTKLIHSKTANFYLSIFFGLITGVLYWIWFRGSWPSSEMIHNLSIGFSIILGSLTLYLILSYFKIKNSILFLLSIGFYSVWILIINLIKHSVHYYELIIGFYILLFFIYLGFLTISLSDKGWKSIKDSFYHYLNKSIEVLTISGLFAIVGAVMISMFQSLFYVGNLRMSFDIMSLVIFTVFSLIPFFAIHLVYDFDKDLKDQKESYSVIQLLSKLFFGVAVIMGIFLLFFIIALLPSGFSQILDLGSAVSTFLTLLVGITIIVYFMTLFFDYTKFKKKTKLVGKIVLLVLILESLVINCVNAYAIYLRVDQYGFTLNRFLVVIGVSFFFLLFGMYLIVIIRKLFIKENLKKMLNCMKRVNFMAALIILIVGFSITTFIDLDKLSIQSQINKFKNSENLEEKMDRYYFYHYGEDSIEILEDAYSEASTKAKIDIILALTQHTNVYYSGSDYRGNKAMAALERIEKTEENTDLINLIKEIKPMANKYSMDNAANLNKICSENVRNILDLKDTNKDFDKVMKFCQYW